METSQYLSEVLKELQWVPQLISDEESEQLIQSIAAANKVFVAGAGRSGFMIRPPGKKGFCPVLVDIFPVGRSAIAGRHAQHVPDGQMAQIRTGIFRMISGKRKHRTSRSRMERPPTFGVIMMRDAMRLRQGQKSSV